MNVHRKITIYSSKTGESEVRYWEIPDAEIERRIAAYEKQYGMPFKRYERSFSCSHANHEEVFDLQDWKTLIEERTDRTKTARRRGMNEPAYRT